MIDWDEIDRNRELNREREELIRKRIKQNNLKYERFCQERDLDKQKIENQPYEHYPHNWLFCPGLF
jgi:hypothetical protein